MTALNRVIIGDCRETLATLPECTFQCCVTSPPYWGLRDYGHPDQIGMEATPDDYVAELVEVFRAVRRVLRDDGTLWLNLGDSYASSTKGSGGPSAIQDSNVGARYVERRFDLDALDLKPKDLCGIPWRTALALRADGWYLRSDIIWAKPSPMPESVTDRPTKSHEYVFLLAKSERYFYDINAIRERHRRPMLAAKTAAPGGSRPSSDDQEDSGRNDGGRHGAGGFPSNIDLGVNARTVWTIASQPYNGAHFATMPRKLAERCIMAGSRLGSAVLDPFMGSGTTGLAAEGLGRQWLGCELSADYERLIDERTVQAGLPWPECGGGSL